MNKVNLQESERQADLLLMEELTEISIYLERWVILNIKVSQVTL